MKRNLITAIASLAVLGTPFVAKADAGYDPALQPKARQAVSAPASAQPTTAKARIVREMPSAFEAANNAQ